jgi:hypothetical protein
LFHHVVLGIPLIGKGRGVAKNEDLLAKLDQQLKAVPEDAPAREDLMRKRKATKDALDKAKKAKSDQSKKSGKKQQCCLHPHSGIISSHLPRGGCRRDPYSLFINNIITQHTQQEDTPLSFPRLRGVGDLVTWRLLAALE